MATDEIASELCIKSIDRTLEVKERNRKQKKRYVRNEKLNHRYAFSWRQQTHIARVAWRRGLYVSVGCEVFQKALCPLLCEEK